MKLTIPEILKKVESVETKEQKVAILKEQTNNKVFVDLVRLNFDGPRMNLPEGEPPFRKDMDLPVGYSDTNLYQEARRLYIFFQPNINLTKTKIESLFIQILEGIHWTEAEFLCAVKDRGLQRLYPSVTIDLFNEAFPHVKVPVSHETKSVTKETNESKEPDERDFVYPLESTTTETTEQVVVTEDSVPKKKRGRPKKDQTENPTPDGQEN